jgi:hypothetical protein
MTFERWYSSTIAPQLEQSLKPLPKAVHGQLRKASRETYVLCWNAALREVCDVLTAVPVHLIAQKEALLLVKQLQVRP